MSYASLLDGCILFGTYDGLKDVSGDIDIIIDTRCAEDGGYEEVVTDDSRRLVKYEIRPHFEPLNKDHFEKWLTSMAKEVDDGAKVYIIDMHGAGRSALIAWCLLRRCGKISINDSLEAVNAAYRSREDVELRWKDLGAPRYCRQRTFGRWLLEGSAWPSFYTKRERHARGEARKNRARRESGQARVGYTPRRLADGHTLRPYLSGFKNIYLTHSDKKWGSLHPKKVGPIKFEMVSMTGNHEEDYAYNLRNLTYAMSVYPEQIGEDGNPNPGFYELRGEILHTMKPLTRHPSAEHVGSGRFSKPRYYVWKHCHFSEVEFRVLVWTRLYEETVSKLPAYAELRTLRNSGTNVYLLEHSSVDLVEEGIALEEAMLNPNFDWSFAYVLYGMISNYRPWAVPDDD